jgi:hypothetical protein
MPMSYVGPAMWQRGEELYLEAADDDAKKLFSSLSDSDKKGVIREFVKRNAAPTKEGKEWTKLLLDMLQD